MNKEKRNFGLLVTGITTMLFMFSSVAMAADKVVVIPLGSKKVGSDSWIDGAGTVTTTDDVGIGTTTPSAKLEVRGEIRSTDDVGNNRLWGDGRPGVTVDFWSNTTSKGYRQGMGNVSTRWDNAAAGCPANTWVCSEEDMDFTYVGVQGKLSIRRYCNGDRITMPTLHTDGWLTDADEADSGKAAQISLFDDSFSATYAYTRYMCESLPVWCCQTP